MYNPDSKTIDLSKAWFILEAMEEHFNKKAFDFYMEFIYPFSKMPRAGWSKYCDVPKEKSETVATHIFEVAFFAQFAIREAGLNLNMQKVLELALVHELEELIIGDIPVRDENIDKKALKAYARAKLEEKLNGFESKDYFLSLLDENEAQKSPEAKFVKEIDKLIFSLHGAGYCKDKIGQTCDGKKLTEYSLPAIENEILRQIAEYIMENF